ncbi:MAG: sensor histidine kinase [Acidobacteriota bacterium]|jgi:two-component system sensor histidine kinase CpxA
MKPKFRLSTKMILIAIGNVSILALLLLSFVRWQLGQEFESFLMTTARERIVSEARSIALETRDSEPSLWTELLADHSRRSGVTFALYRPNGDWVAGPQLSLPPALKERMNTAPPRLPGMRPPWESGPPSPDFPRDVPPARVLINFGAGPFLITASSGGYDYWVMMRTYLPPTPTLDRPSRAVLLIASPNLLTNPFFFQLGPWLAIGLVGILVSIVFWFPLVRGLTRSLEQMTIATANIAEGGFDTQLPVNRSDELGLLAASINRMAARLGAYTHGQKRFLGDVAHELRSPLGRMQIALGILDRKVDESAASYIHDLSDDVKVMSGLTDGLLEFAKAEMRQDSVTLSPVNLSDLVWRAVKAESIPGVSFEVDIDPALTVQAESESLFRALSNVLRNAARYAGDSGPIHISATAQKSAVHLTVRDSGPGVPTESLDQIFEPFYRLEYARDRASGGAGLGLAIVKSCVEACGGRVSCRNLSPHGLEVDLTLAPTA